MNAKHWVGLDVGVYTTSICVTDDQGSVVELVDIESGPDRVIAMLRNYPGIQMVALESGVGNYLTRALRKAEIPAVMFDAFKASRFLAIRRNKSDRNDARGLADLARLRRGSISEVLVRNRECQSIRSKLRLRRGIIKQRLAAENILRAQLYEYGKVAPKSVTPAAYRKLVSALIAELEAEGADIDVVNGLDSLLDFALNIRAYAADLTKQVGRLAKKNDVCRRLMTIPGIGALSALSFYSTIEDPWRFKNLADVGAYIGLAPMVRQTGGKASRARISRAGDALTRANLYVAARILMGHGFRECELSEWALRTKERVGARRAKVALARKLAIVMAAVWKSGGEFVAYPNAAPTGGEPDTSTGG